MQSNQVLSNELGAEVIFFDVRDTLGEVDRPGHLILYPSTLGMLEATRKAGLRVGIITNLPDNVTAEQGRKMIADAGLMEFIDADGVIINHEAGLNKPDPAIFRYAAHQMGVSVEQCIFSGENYQENISALAVGMKTKLKPCPPGREFSPAPYQRGPVTPTDSGRAFEQLFEHEHLLGDRIFECGGKIVEELRALKPGQEIPKNVKTGMGFLIYLINNFADQVHLLAEEAAIQLGLARGIDPKRVQWVLNHHEQARAYWRSMNVAWKRILGGDEEDQSYAIGDFWRSTDAFVILFKHHAVRENDHLYKDIGDLLTDTDDSLLLNIVQHTGPSDITPYVGIVAAMEQALGVTPPQP